MPGGWGIVDHFPHDLQRAALVPRHNENPPLPVFTVDPQ
jgi:hypothetical protein